MKKYMVIVATRYENAAGETVEDGAVNGIFNDFNTAEQHALFDIMADYLRNDVMIDGMRFYYVDGTRIAGHNLVKGYLGGKKCVVDIYTEHMNVND